jgi:hypothetical protein
MALRRRNRGDDDYLIRRHQIGNAREMDVEHRDQRSGLQKFVLQFVADPKFQSRSLRAATLGALPRDGRNLPSSDKQYRQ